MLGASSMVLVAGETALTGGGGIGKVCRRSYDRQASDKRRVLEKKREADSRGQKLGLGVEATCGGGGWCQPPGSNADV
jgi:hypothetical protein